MNKKEDLQLDAPPKSSINVFAIIIITVLAAALIVGGGIYAWQKSNLKSAEQNLQQQITFLQNQVEQIKQVKQVADSTSDLKQQKLLEEQLQQQLPQQQSGADAIELQAVQANNEIDDSIPWRKYMNEEYGFSFEFYDEYEEYKDKFLEKTVKNDAYGENENCIYFFGKREITTNNNKIISSDNVAFAIYPYNKKWFETNGELAEEYDSDVKSNVKAGYIKGKRGLQGSLGIYLGENNNYIFFINDFFHDCPSSDEYCALRLNKGIKKMVIDSFKIIDEKGAN